MEKIQIQNINWLDIVDPKKKDINYLKQVFHFHPIVLNELSIPTLRAKVEQYDHYLYMVLHFPIYSPKEKTSKSMEIDFLITPTYLITVRYGKIQPLFEFWKKCEAGEHDPHIQESTASLLYCMLQELNSFSLRQIDHISKKIDKIEKEIEELSPQERLKLVEKLAHQLRRTGSTVRKEIEWSKLYGLGKGLWKEDAQEYVNRLREERI